MYIFTRVLLLTLLATCTKGPILSHKLLYRIRHSMATVATASFAAHRSSIVENAIASSIGEINRGTSVRLRPVCRVCLSSFPASAATGGRAAGRRSALQDAAAASATTTSGNITVITTSSAAHPFAILENAIASSIHQVNRGVVTIRSLPVGTVFVAASTATGRRAAGRRRGLETANRAAAPQYCICIGGGSGQQ
jgi:hypothetical protein